MTPESEGPTKEELYERAQELEIEGRSTMSKDELAEAVAEAEGHLPEEAPDVPEVGDIIEDPDFAAKLEAEGVTIEEYEGEYVVVETVAPDSSAHLIPGFGMGDEHTNASHRGFSGVVHPSERKQVDNASTVTDERTVDFDDLVGEDDEEDEED